MIIEYAVIENEFGQFAVFYHESQIIHICDEEQKSKDFTPVFATLKTILGHEPALIRRKKLPIELHDQMQAAFQSNCDFKINNASFPFPHLSDFAREVLAQVSLIPHGETRSYLQIAQATSKPRAVRAAASHVANNPVPLLIPCHRVIRNNGDFGKYALGPELKMQLLEREAAKN